MSRNDDNRSDDKDKHELNFQFSRRRLLQAGAGLFSAVILPELPHFHLADSAEQVARKRIYIAADDHTDYYWAGDGEQYRQAFLNMIDYYLDLTDSTANNASDFQSRWNCDGSFWLWTYERNRTPAQFERLIGRIQDGHFSAPLTPLVILLGGAPAEAVLRGMYYAGQIERRYNLRFKLAVSMEDQTLPYGLGSLWAGAGAQYSWKGICGCKTQLSVDDLGKRDHEIYWWVGPDGSRILMKWYSVRDAYSIGGYAEARKPGDVVELVDTGGNFKAIYPYQVIGAFGRGGDDLQTLTDEFPQVAQDKSNDTRQVIVSNEQDFFADFEKTYGAGLPSQSCSFGNEWELYCTSMAEVSADVKRLVERLRSAEALASMAVMNNASFMDGRKDARNQAWMSIGLYWEHNWTANGHVHRDVRAAWEVQVRDDIATYVNALQADSLQALADAIPATAGAMRFFVFNPLNWTRTDSVDYPYSGATPVYVTDVTTGQQTSSQIVRVNGTSFLRILATDIPSVGYKVFEIHGGEGASVENAPSANGSVLENEFLRVTMADRGAILSVIDKRQGNREFVQVIDNLAANDLGAASGTLTVENVGLVSATLVAQADQPVAHTSRVTLTRGSDRIDIRNEITENFSDVLTWSYGFAIDTPNVWHEEVGAIINAKLLSEGGHYANHDARYDWLTLNHFADMSGADGVGITLSNADCYFMNLGHSAPNQLDSSTPKFSVLAGGQVDGSDLGIQNQNGDKYFLQRFALQTHSAYDPLTAMRFALEHQNPLLAAQVSGAKVAYPADSFSFVSVSSLDVLLWAIKPADDTDQIIVRLWNLTSQPVDFELAMPQFAITAAQAVTHIETPTGTATVANHALTETLGAYQMRTFSLEIARK